MTSGSDFGAQQHNLAVIAEQVRQLDRRFDEAARRQTRTEDAVSKLLLLPVQMEDTRRDITEIKASVGELAKEHQNREQWLEQFRLQVAGFQQNREQSIKSGYMTVVVLMVGVISTIIGVLASVIIKAFG